MTDFWTGFVFCIGVQLSIILAGVGIMYISDVVRGQSDDKTISEKDSDR